MLTYQILRILWSLCNISRESASYKEYLHSMEKDCTVTMFVTTRDSKSHVVGGGIIQSGNLKEMNNLSYWWLYSRDFVSDKTALFNNMTKWRISLSFQYVAVTSWSSIQLLKKCANARTLNVLCLAGLPRSIVWLGNALRNRISGD